MINQVGPFPDPIVWDFSITEQGQVARYGSSGPYFYKQFMPYGIEMPDLHPPHRIDERTYRMAQHFKDLKSTPNTPG